MTPSTSSVLPFRFRPRQERVDWRRINTVDVDLVVSQLDVDALQEHITNVTFCSLEDERCQRCRSHLDPVLVKLLRLAQLSIEWLMHCQELHAANLREAEERVAAGHKEQERLLAQQKEQEERVVAGHKEQEEKVKMLTAELKQRKKIIKMQQTMLNTVGKKCPHCEKRFLNTTFLQSHKQQHHPEEYEMELQSISGMKSQNERLKLEISSLKEQIVQQQQGLQTRTDQDKKWDDKLQEIKTQHESETNKLLNKLEELSRRLQELQENYQRLQEEMSRRLQEQQENNQRLQEEMGRRLQEQQENNQRLQEERSRELQTEQNKQRLQELQENNQLLQEERSRELQTEQNNQRLQEEMSRMQSEYDQRLQEEMSRMQSEYDQRLQEEMSRIQSEYDQRLQEDMSRRLQEQQDNKQRLQEERSRELQTEQNKQRLQELQENNQQLQEEMSRLQSEYDQRLQEEMNRMQSEYDQRLQEKEQTIKVQRKQNRNISSHPPTKIMEVPVMVSAPAPEPKTKRVILEKPVSAPKLDPVQEIPEEEEVSERRPVEKKPVPKKRKPKIKKKMKKPELAPEKGKPKIKKEMRLNVVQALNEKQENLGVKPDQSRLTDKEFNSILAQLHSDRDSIAKRVPDHWHYREEINSTMEQLVSQRRGRDSAPESQTRSRQSVQDSSSVSERRPVKKKPESVPEKRKPKIKKEMRLENLGVKPDQSRLTDKKPSSVLAKVHSKLKSVAKLVSQRRGRDSAPESQTRSRQSVQVSQILPTKTVVPKMESDEEDDEDWWEINELLETNPKPKPSPKSQRPERQCGEKNLWTPPFSSAEESEGEDPEEEQPQIHQRGKSPQPRQIQVQPSTSKTSPIQTIPAPAKHSSSNFHQTKGSVTKTVVTKTESNKEKDEDCLEAIDLLENGNVENRNFGKVSQILPTKTVVPKMESDKEDDEDWSEISELLETPNPNPLQSHRDQNGNVENRNFGLTEA